uniref:Glutathione peroxidase n=1 Tax=Salix viminalis TaxID=40686 RepID=A0A6N2N937_SALVM
MGCSLQSPNLPGFVSKARSFGVSARAATERSIHDFTVKDIDGKDVALSKFKGKSFEILAFPCNQFGGQEPGSNPEIKQFACTKYKAEFPILDKWNFEKFLVDKNGKVVERYQPTTSPFQLEKDIQKLLAA